MDEPQVLESWRKVSILGSGGFGIVSLWRNEETNETVAVKKCRWSKHSQIGEKQQRRWIMEVDFMKTVKHENIVAYKTLPAQFLNLLGSYNPSGLPLLPMEYCCRGNLRHYLSKPENSCGLRESEVHFILSDLSAAISYLHRCNITHRDIKPENVVLQNYPQRPNRIIYKIIDLGYAKEMDALVSFVGTVPYVAPEIFQRQTYSHTVDYWSFGTLVYEIVCNKHPFLPKLSPVQRFELIEAKRPEHICVYQSQNDKFVYTDEILRPHHISGWLKGQLEAWLRIVLRYDPEERGKSSEGGVFKHLDRILKSKTLQILSVYNYEFYNYEINDNITMGALKHLLEKDTGVQVDRQLILSKNIFISDEELLKDYDFQDTVLFNKDAFIKPIKINLPLAICNLLKKQVQYRYNWDELYAQMTVCVHFIEKERQKMQGVQKSIQMHLDYVRKFHNELIALFFNMRHIAQKVLKQIDVLIDWHLTKNTSQFNNGEEDSSLKKFRRNLWRAKELIENANAATVRIHKLKVKERLLQVSYGKIRDTLWSKINLQKLREDSMDCLNITKHTPEITSCAITKVICTCLEYRDKFHTHETLKQHFHIAGKIIREMNKLNTWINCLTEQFEKMSNDFAKNPEAFKGDPKVDSKLNGIVKEKLTIDEKFFGVLDEIHKTHLKSLNEFQEFSDFIDSFNGK